MDYYLCSGLNSYNPDELRRAGRVLIQEVEYGPLQWLSSNLQQNSFDSNARFPNVWEGMDGMMDHVYDQFPMPPCTYTQEQPNAEPYDANIRDWLPLGCSPQQSSQVEAVGTFKETLSSNNRITESTVCEASIYNKDTSNRGFTFWAEIATIYDELHNLLQTVSGADKKLTQSDPQAVKEACHELSNLYRKMTLISSNLLQKTEEVSRYGQNNIFKSMSELEKAIFKRDYGIKGNLPNRWKNVKSLLDHLRARFRDILHAQAKIIEPHKDILRDVLKDLVPESSEGDHCLHSNKSVRTSKLVASGISTVLKEKGLCKSGDTFVKTPTLSDIASALNTDKDLFTAQAQSGHKGDNLKTSSELDTDELNDSDEIEEDSGGEDGLEPETHMLDNSAEINERCDSKLDCSKVSEEATYLNNLSFLRSEIINTLSKTNELYNKSRSAPSGKGKRVTNRSKCEQTVSMYKKICSLISFFSKLRNEKTTKNYRERGPLRFEELNRLRRRNSIPGSTSLEVVEVLLTKLKSTYMKVRGEKSTSLQKFGLISNPKDLIFTENEIKKLVRICAHSESEVDVRVMSCSKYSNKRCAPLSKLSKDLRQASSHSKIETGYVHTQASVSCSEVSTDTFNNWRALSENPSQTCSLPESTLSNRPDFLETEREHWDRLQKLYVQIDLNVRYFQKKTKHFSIGSIETNKTMNTYYHKINKYNSLLDTEKSESCQAGYCKEVIYSNLEDQSKNCARLLVKSLEKVESKLNTLNEHFRNAAKTFHLSHLYQ